jgi:hypothetical protein
MRQLLICVQFYRTSHSGIQWVMWRKIGNILLVDLKSHLYSIQRLLRTHLIGCLVTWKEQQTVRPSVGQGKCHRNVFHAYKSVVGTEVAVFEFRGQ